MWGTAWCSDTVGKNKFLSTVLRHELKHNATKSGKGQEYSWSSHDSIILGQFLSFKKGS